MLHIFYLGMVAFCAIIVVVWIYWDSHVRCVSIILPNNCELTMI